MMFGYNLDLLSVGFIMAAMSVLGVAVFLNNRKSITNKVFLIFSIATILWSGSNYLSYQFSDLLTVLVLSRLSILFAIAYTFWMLTLFYVFPYERIKFSKLYWFTATPAAIIVGALSMTKFVFVKVDQVALSGGAVSITNGPGIFLFGATLIGFLFSGITIFIRKMVRVPMGERSQYRLMLTGLSITFALHITFNFVFPAFLGDIRYIPFGAVFAFPFVFFTSYAIFKHRMFNLKVISVEILAFVLSIISLIEIVFEEDRGMITLRFAVFLMTLGVSWFLIKSVLKEVRQREELQKLTADLQVVNEELKRTEKLKAEFFSFAAHQVKSPMAVIKGYATLIGDGTLAGVPADKIVEIAKKIGAAASRTLAMVNNLLDMRKIEEGRMVYSFEELNVVPPIHTIAIDLETIAKDKGLELKFEASQEEILLHIDMQKFTQVIQNLIDNAVKYTDTGWVKIGVALSNGNVLFTVSDSGRGISKDFAANMFTQFARDPALAQDTKGTGLGLFIAKQIVEAHGGRIWAASEGEGAGSTFSVEIPVDNKAATEKMGE